MATVFKVECCIIITFSAVAAGSAVSIFDVHRRIKFHTVVVTVNQDCKLVPLLMTSFPGMNVEKTERARLGQRYELPVPQLNAEKFAEVLSKRIPDCAPQDRLLLALLNRTGVLVPLSYCSTIPLVVLSKV